MKSYIKNIVVCTLLSSAFFGLYADDVTHLADSLHELSTHAAQVETKQEEPGLMARFVGWFRSPGSDVAAVEEHVEHDVDAVEDEVEDYQLG